MADFSNSLEKIVLGMVRGIVLSSEERERTASHRTAWNVAPAAEELVDTEARKIIEECCGQALATLRGRRDRLDRLARTLLEGETLDEDDAYAAAGIDPGNRPAPIARGGAPSTPQRRPSAAHASRGRTIRCGRDRGSHGQMRRGDTVTAEELLATGTWHQHVRWPM
jgi:Peptidase family M41